jgi:hypothetical protein
VTVIATVVGALLVLVALRDVFDTLLHPHGHGIVRQRLLRGVWSVMRRAAKGDHAVLSLAGPLAFISVIAAWGGLVIMGFALILWPHFPNEFALRGDVGVHHALAEAIYLSMVNLTSLGYGDIVATGDVLRYLGPLETLIGLGLLTASISWILFLYRVLSDYRSLSHELSLLLDAERRGGTRLAEIDPAVAARVLADLTSRVVAVRDDLVHSPIAYYFHPRDARHALPVLLPKLIDVVDECSVQSRAGAVRFQAAILRQALDDLLETIADDFVGIPAGDPAEALAAYRRDHLWATA